MVTKFQHILSSDIIVCSMSDFFGHLEAAATGYELWAEVDVN